MTDWEKNLLYSSGKKGGLKILFWWVKKELGFGAYFGFPVELLALG